MARDPYPEIGQILADSADGAWESVVLDAALGDGWARFRAAAYTVDAVQRGVRITDLDRLEALLEQVRELTREVGGAGQPDWTTARFILMRDGRFEVEFGYEPI